MAKILVIDDSNVQRTYVRLVCQDAGHEVAEASDGGTGISQAVDGAPELILLDLQMPDMSGQDVLRRLNQQGIAVPVIVLTADDPAAVEAECLELGATRVVEKPDDPAELTRLVAAALG